MTAHATPARRHVGLLVFWLEQYPGTPLPSFLSEPLTAADRETLQALGAMGQDDLKQWLRSRALRMQERWVQTHPDQDTPWPDDANLYHPPAPEPVTAGQVIGSILMLLLTLGMIAGFIAFVIAAVSVFITVVMGALALSFLVFCIKAIVY